MKISGSQLFAILLCSSAYQYQALAPALLTTRQDAWIVIGIAGVISLGLTFLISRASLAFAGNGFVRGSQELLGKRLGTSVVVLYCVIWLLITVRDLRDWMDYVYVALLTYTPLYVTLGITVAFILYLILKRGVTSIGRSGEVAILLYILTMGIPLIMMPNALDWNHLLPIYVDSGWRNISVGIIGCVANFSEPAMTCLILAQFMAKPEHLRWVPMLAVGSMTLWTFLASIVCILFVGADLSARCTNPWLTYIKSINVLDFIQNVDTFSAFVWTFANSIGISVFLFSSSYGIAENWKSKHWRLVSIVFGFTASVCVLLSLRVTHLTTMLREAIFVPWVLPVNMIGIPLLFWILERRKKNVVL